MTRDQFLSRLAEHDKDLKAGEWARVLSLLVYLIVSCGVLTSFAAVHEKSVFVPIGGLAILGVMFGGLILMDRRVKTLAKRHGLLCPKCGLRLTRIAAQIVVASGRCGKCGSKLLDD
jgi:hypothetical protein